MIDHPDLQLLEKSIKTDLIGQSVEKFTFLQVNPQYFEFDANGVWVLDGGVEISLSNGKTMAYAWNKVVELMDLVQGQASVLLEDLDYYELDKVNEIINGALANKVIQSVDIEWNWYQMMDDNFELEEQLHFAPLGIVLGFEDDKSLQLAAIQFGLDDKSIANLSYLPEGDLLVSLNNTFDIHLNDDEA